MTPVLARSYDRERPGVTEAAIERGESLLLDDFEEWEGATGLRERLEEELAPEIAQRAWDWYRTSSFISCPVRTAGGRTLGVLAISSRPPHGALGPEELRLVEVFADLAALALERTELLDREERRGRDERELNDAVRAVSASLELDTVYTVIVEQAGQLVGASKVALRRYEPATADLRTVAAIGFTDESVRTRFGVGEGMIGHVARTGESYVSDSADADRFARAFVEREGIGSFVHVPIALGPRLFGVLTASHESPATTAPSSSRASRRSRCPPPAPSPTRSTSTASAASPPRSRAGSSPAAPTTCPASSSASSTSRPATTSAAATSSACGHCRAGRWRCSWATSPARASRSPR